MRKDVLNISDLQDIAPFFSSRFGKFTGERLIKWLSIDKVNKVHGDLAHLRGADFTSNALAHPLIDIKYKIHNEERLDLLPEGTFTTVSNHPIGSLDGVILIDIFASLRPDFKVLVNGILGRIHAMKQNFISVKPDSKKQGANIKNMNGIRAALAHIEEGHPIGFFPAGGVSSYDRKKKKVCDHKWALNIMRLIRKAEAPVLPVYFAFKNSELFYRMGSINWKLRSLRIPAELFNKCGKTLDVYIGELVSVQEIQQITSDRELANFLYDRTYQAANPKMFP